VTAKAIDREDTIKKVKEMGPGRVSVGAITPLPHGFLAVSLTHVTKNGQRMGYTTILTRPDEG
jgi:hypothetical protein